MHCFDVLLCCLFVRSRGWPFGKRQLQFHTDHVDDCTHETLTTVNKKKQAYFIVHKIWHNTNELPLTMLIHGVAISSFIFAYIETVCARLFDRYFAIFDLLFSSQIDYVFEATISRVSIVN